MRKITWCIVILGSLLIASSLTFAQKSILELLDSGSSEGRSQQPWRLWYLQQRPQSQSRSSQGGILDILTRVLGRPIGPTGLTNRGGPRLSNLSRVIGPYCFCRKCPVVCQWDFVNRICNWIPIPGRHCDESTTGVALRCLVPGDPYSCSPGCPSYPSNTGKSCQLIDLSAGCPDPFC